MAGRRLGVRLEVSESILKVVSFGGGVNSTAVLIGLHDRSEIPDAILFADTGGEKPKSTQTCLREPSRLNETRKSAAVLRSLRVLAGTGLGKTSSMPTRRRCGCLETTKLLCAIPAWIGR